MDDAPPSEAPAPSRARVDWQRGLRWYLPQFAVTVTGVLVALAVNAWWSGQQDARLEQTYLRQLAADLRETEARIDLADSVMAGSERAGGLLVRAYQMPDAPPLDSLFAWVRGASRYRYPIPVTGTAEALVATGDLTLVGDEAVRSSVMAYLSESQVLVDDFRSDVAAFESARDHIYEAVDYQDILTRLVPRAALDSMARAEATFPVPAGARRARFPTTAVALLSNRAAYAAAERMNAAKTNMKWDRASLRELTASLRARVEALTE